MVEQAIYNVDNAYVVVGLYEELDAFMEVLEFLMPRMFTDARETLEAQCKCVVSTIVFGKAGDVIPVAIALSSLFLLLLTLAIKSLLLWYQR